MVAAHTVLVWCGVGKGHSRATPASIPHPTALPVDGIMHDEHFVLVPGPFSFLQGKKLKMSTSDAVLENKDRAERQSRDIFGKLLSQLCCCSPATLC